MRSPATKEQRPDACSCAQNLAQVADLLRQALAILERPTTYSQGVAHWEQQVRGYQRRQHPQDRVGATDGSSAPRAARPSLTRGGQS